MGQKKTIKTEILEKQIAGLKEEENREKRDRFMLTIFVMLFMGLLYFAVTGVVTDNKSDAALNKDNALKKNTQPSSKTTSMGQK